jgi:hypothetical protein
VQYVQGSHGGSGCWLTGKVVKIRWKEWKTKPSMDGDFNVGCSAYRAAMAAVAADCLKLTWPR